MSKYSIIVVSYERPNHLIRCLKSIRDQSHQDLIELIITDDGTPGKDQKNISLDLGGIFISAPRTANLGIVLNRGIRSATFDNLILLSQDMILDPDYLEVIFDNNYPEKDTIIYGEIFFLSEFDSDNKARIDDRANRYGIPPLKTVFRSFLHNEIVPKKLFPFWSVADALDTVIKKEIFDRFPLSEDFYNHPNHLFPEWLSRLWINNIKFKYCPDLAVSHQKHILSSALPDGESILAKSLDIYNRKLAKNFAGFNINLSYGQTS